MLALVCRIINKPASVLQVSLIYPNRFFKWRNKLSKKAWI